MCCRYRIWKSPEMVQIIEAMNRSPLTAKVREHLPGSIVTSGEVFPTNIVPAVAPDRRAVPTVYPMLWGFKNPRGGQPLINCRVETAGAKPLWKEAWSSHRCAVPMSGYYEWKHTPLPNGKTKAGEKYLIRPKGEAFSYLAGLYRIEEKDGIQIPVFTVLTREPAEEIRFIHDRMPVILTGNLVSAWIAPDAAPEDIVCQAVTAMDFILCG